MSDHTSALSSSASTSSSVNRILAAQIYWEVSLHIRGFTPRRGRAMTVEQALNKINKGLNMVFPGCSVHRRLYNLMELIIQGNGEGEESLSSTTT